MKKIILLLIWLFIIKQAFAQKADSTVIADSASLQNVTVNAFETKTKWKDVAATVSILNKKDLQRFDVNSMLSAMNTVAGVRMEERSPGSYRLSVRGSLLRSPFGVRDVKIYLDGVPFTDATGNTYLNLIDPNQLQSAEIIKGPSSSIYGANTGGVVLLSSLNNIGDKKNRFDASLNGGSYGMFNEQAGWQTQEKTFSSSLQQSYMQSDGFRKQTAMHKDVIKWNGRFNINASQSLSFIAFYTDLYYQTPGGLTQAQMDADPTQARLASGSIPGAQTQHAAVTNKTGFIAATLTSNIGKNFTNITSFVIDHTGFTNPTFTSYEHRSEWNYNARTSFGYKYKKNDFILHATGGVEIGYNVAHINDYGNRAGVQDTVQYKDLTQLTQYFIFAQVSINAGRRWLFQVGGSNNATYYWFNRLTDLISKYPQTRSAGPLITPRISALYQLTNSVSIYASASEGFSTPTLAEIRPTNGTYYPFLQPEYGWNYEAGIKGALLKSDLEFNASVYYFALKQAIVSRTDSAGVQYFVNAGSTKQNGAEIWFKAHLIHNNMYTVASLDIWNSFSYQPYRFTNYTVGTNNYSGNKLTGVPTYINVSGVDINTKNAFYGSIIFNATSSIPLDDANSAFAKRYYLLQVKVGKYFKIHTCKLNTYFGIDNLLNEVYSLGNDINAAGKRYFNPAPKRNFFIGARLTF